MFVFTNSILFVLDSTMKRNIDGMKSLGCCTLVVIVFIKCSLAVTVNELEINPKLTLIADEVKEQSEKSKERSNLKKNPIFIINKIYISYNPYIILHP